MKRLILLAALGSGLAVAGCDEPIDQRSEMAPPPIQEPMAPAAEDQGVPASDTAAANPPPIDSALPPEKRTSEETVQPESETLFY
ncbi:MAG: hypothetical protein KKA16_08310 [Alphaproteobacteria bacterium]|nr:hypothetical protein [Alphaproteobacteria bacterium]MBU2379234.1 hypothetical protein [Alphaproteobacteria bacterium]